MCMMEAAVCLRCIDSCSKCLGCNSDRIVAAHRTELFNVAEATCRSSLGGYSTHVTSLKTMMNAMQASRTTANAFGSAPCCWQKLISKAQFRTLNAGIKSLVMLLPSKVVAWHCIRMCRHISNYGSVLKSECSSCLSPVSLCSQSWTLYRVQCALHLLHLAVELSRHPTDHDAQAWGPGP
ncbi:TPA: hypothetical protein ACH3X3_002167 [Trebouxia sp. C0006]